jgi:hypothetical protein
MTYLQKVREINEHIVPSFFLSAGNVNADCDDVDAFATFGKLVLDGKGVQTCRS